jgi:hypothetical protein
MHSLTRLMVCILLAIFCTVRPSLGQSVKVDNSADITPIVTARATGELVRFAASGEVVQLRLEVLSGTGQAVFDVQAKGNVLDWAVADGTGTRLQAGTYLCVVTIKRLSGRLSQRIGSLEIVGQQMNLLPADPSQMTQAQQQAVGPLESQASLSVQPGDVNAATTVTHDGTQGALTRNTGALSFRLGDVFSGKDKEQMRLTEEGNLGIGTDKPETKLDVAGDISARGTIRADKVEFADGTVQTTGLSGRKLADGTLAPNVTGTGTQNRVAKWTDNAGTLGDSSLSDVGGLVGIGTPSPLTELHINQPVGAGTSKGLLFSGDEFFQSGNGTDNAGVVLLLGVNRPGNRQLWVGDRSNLGSSTNGFFRIQSGSINLMDAVTGNGLTRLPLGLGTETSNVGVGFNDFNTGGPGAKLSVAGNLAVGTGFKLNAAPADGLIVQGSVGIGNTAPGAKLDVTGNINTSTQYNISGLRVLSVPGTSNTFAGVNAGSSNNAGSGNSFFGNNTGFANTSGSSNSFVGSNAGMANASGGGNSFFGTDAGRTNSAGHFNSFFGNQAGRNNTASNNSFFGQNAGFGNTTGTFNSFFGLEAGFANNEGFFNSFFGYRAGASTTGPTASANSFFGNQAGQANSSGNNNSFFGASAGQSNSIGNNNSFFGSTAGFSNTDGINNSFFGIGAGFNNVASANSFFGFNAGMANTDGINNAFFGGFSGQANTASGNAFFGRSSGSSNTIGFNNAFFGASAGQSNTEACCNSFFGANAGTGNSTGTNNSFFGEGAGELNVIGADNSFFGRNAGAHSIAQNNSFFGSLAGDANTMGANNAFFGSNAGGSNTNGSSNIVIGSNAGLNLVAGSNNIYLANAGADESDHIRIGTEGTQTATFIAGINGINVNPSTSVVVNSSGQLGVVLSSRRYKQDIRDMGGASNKLMQLRPVTFQYRSEYVGGDQTLQYGLIAEEVAKVYPDLVALGPDGKPQTVRYHLLNTMLLNEVQKQEMHLQSQAKQLQSQAQRIADLERRLRRLEPRTSRRHRRR